MIKNKQYYLDTFSVTENDMDRLISEALKSGGDYADLYFENSSYNSLMLRDGKVNSGGMHVDYGVGVRVLKGEKTGYAYAESTDQGAMTSAARAASMISRTPADVTAASSGARYHGTPNPAADRYPALCSWADADASLLIPFLDKIQKSVSERDCRVVKIIAMLSGQTSDILMFNSYGELKYETRPMGTVSVSAIFSQNGRFENKSASKSLRTGYEMLTDELVAELADKVTRGVDLMFEARRPKGGKMSVVMGAGASGILLHEAMGHAFEADFNRKGQSIFCDRMGQRICPEGITIVDDGTLRNYRGSLNFDDEGVPGQHTVMVEDGILTSFLHDRISAGYYGVSPTGNGRRESFRYSPLPRMRSTYMEAGEADPEDIIASVKKGIYVDEFSNGQVKIGEGDFTFYVKSGSLIENGRLTRPVKDINIIGNGPQALSDIVMVGNDLSVDTGSWTCGKEQSVPVSCGIPTVLVKNLTVGGE